MISTNNRPRMPAVFVAQMSTQLLVVGATLNSL